MVRKPIAAYPVAGIHPGDPQLMPGMSIALTERQRRELAEAIKRAPGAQAAQKHIQKALMKGEPIARIVESLRQKQALQLQAQMATPERRQQLRQQMEQQPVVITAPRPAPKFTPRPN